MLEVPWSMAAILDKQVVEVNQGNPSGSVKKNN